MTLTVTLDDLVDAVAEFAHSDAEVVATVLHMLASRQVRSAGEGAAGGGGAGFAAPAALRH